MTLHNGQTIALYAIAEHAESSFRKLLYSWPVPGGTADLIGISGTISTNASRDSFNEALISLRWLPSGTCPHNGENYLSYNDIGKRYPNDRPIVANILKSPTSGLSSLPISFMLPQGLTVSNCIFAMLDGSILSGGRYTMNINLQLHFAPPDATVSAEHSRSFGDEFCFGLGSGCGPWHTTNNTQSFASYSAPVKEQTELVAVHGDTSASPLSEDLRRSLKFNLVSGPWSVTNSFYVLRNCTGTPQGRVGPGDHLVPADAIEILHTTLTGTGMVILQQPIHKDFQRLMIPAGGCVVHEVRRTGTGGINAEYQLTLFTRDAQ